MMTPNGKVRVYVGIPSNGPKDWTVTLRAEDATSGELLFEMQVDPAEWVQVQRGLVHVQEAFIGKHLDRVGKDMQVEHFMVPRDVMEAAGYKEPEMRAMAQRWADRHCAGPHAPWADEGGPTEWDVRHQNNGWAVIARRWVDVE